MKQSIERTSEKMFKAMTGRERTGSDEDGLIFDLIKSAFFLYDEAWKSCHGHKHKIENWLYPFNELENSSPFTPARAWDVLFKKALEIAKTTKSEG